jgi:hypothetical protein
VIAATAMVAILLGCGLAPEQPAATPTDVVEASFDVEDQARAGVSVQPVSNPSGLLSRGEAIAIARADYSPPDPDAVLDLFLFEVTAPGSLSGGKPIRERPAWIARYSNLSVTTPGGHVLHYMYNFFDAATGQYLFGTGK